MATIIAGSEIEFVEDIERLDGYRHIVVPNHAVLGLPDSWEFINFILELNGVSVKQAPIVMYGYNEPDIDNFNFYIPIKNNTYNNPYDIATVYDIWLVPEKIYTSSYCLEYIKILNKELFSEIIKMNNINPSLPKRMNMVISAIVH